MVLAYIFPIRWLTNYQPSMNKFRSVSATQKIIHLYCPNRNFPIEQILFSHVSQHCRPLCTFALIRLMTLTGRRGKPRGITGLTVKLDCISFFQTVCTYHYGTTNKKKVVWSKLSEITIILGELTSVLQPLDVCLNKPFKDLMREQWNNWMSGEKSSTIGVAVRVASFDMLWFRDKIMGKI
jgi:hypothetical protein